MGLCNISQHFNHQPVETVQLWFSSFKHIFDIFLHWPIFFLIFFLLTLMPELQFPVRLSQAGGGWLEPGTIHPVPACVWSRQLPGHLMVQQMSSSLGEGRRVNEMTSKRRRQGGRGETNTACRLRKEREENLICSFCSHSCKHNFKY